MADACCKGGHIVMKLAWSGALNVKQLPNQAAVESTREGFGRTLLLEV